MNTLRCLAPLTLAALVCITGCERDNDPTETELPVRSTAPAVTAPATTTSPVNRTSTTTTRTTETAAAADNTSRNRADMDMDTMTPIDQSQSAAHIKITADIRRAIMDDDAMSMNAQNCKIITDKDGRVTLRGVVQSQGEKNLIEAKAKTVAGATMVSNQLEVKAD